MVGIVPVYSVRSIYLLASQRPPIEPGMGLDEPIILIVALPFTVLVTSFAFSLPIFTDETTAVS